MRNPLARLVHRNPEKPTLRERLAATKAKYTRTLAVHRVLNAPPPAPSADRVALVNYSTWLAFERGRVCAELYPHLGVKASRFVLTLNAAERFFWPDGSGDGLSMEWKKVPPASSRAVKVLDLVGVDWRQDLDENSRSHFDAGGRADNGERPALPYGWPAIDAALVMAVGDLQRVDAAINALPSALGRDINDLPEYPGLEDSAGALIGTLTHTPAEGLPGLQAKAKALLSDRFTYSDGDTSEVAQSLARDLLGMRPLGLEPHPDPIVLAIKETRRLMHVADQAHATISQDPTSIDPPGEWGEAIHDLREHIDGVLLQTIPTTSAGCIALARLAHDFQRSQGVSLDTTEGSATVFGLIARSPLL